MAVPAMPGAGLAMIEAKIVLGAQKALLNGPAQPSSRSKFCKCGSSARKSEVIGNVLRVTQATTRQQPAGKPLCGLMSDRDPGPIIEPLPLGAFASGQGLPGLGWQFGNNRCRIGLHQRPLLQKAQGMV